MSGNINTYLLQILKKYQARTISSKVEAELKSYIHNWCKKCNPKYLSLDQEPNEQQLVQLPIMTISFPFQADAI